MPVTVESAMDEPIVRYVFEGALDDETIAEANRQTDDLLDTLGVFYALLDVSALAETPRQVIEALERGDALGLIANSRVHPVMVSARSGEGVTLPVFRGEDDAVDYIRRTIAGHAPD